MCGFVQCVHVTRVTCECTLLFMFFWAWLRTRLRYHKWIWPFCLFFLIWCITRVLSLARSLAHSLTRSLFLSLFLFLSLSRIHSNLALTFEHALAPLSCPFARRSSFLILTKLFTRFFAAAPIFSASSSLLSETPYLPPTRSGYINYLFITLHYILVFPLMQRRFPIWLALVGSLSRQRTRGYGKVPRRVSVLETLSFPFFPPLLKYFLQDEDPRGFFKRAAGDRSVSRRFESGIEPRGGFFGNGDWLYEQKTRGLDPWDA